MRTLVTLLIFLNSSLTANAHVGHLGELAGHAHWVGAGAVIVAGAIAAWLGTRKKDDQEISEEADDEAPDGETA
ncbi:MAG: DUF6732 family protein [Pseudomonadota bacterium]